MKLAKPPGTELWRHKLIATIAVNPDSTALEIAWKTNYRPASCASLLRRLTSQRLVEHDNGPMMSRTYRLTCAGEKLFDDIANYSDAVHRLSKIKTSTPAPRTVEANAVTTATKDHAHERRHATNITSGLARFASGLSRS